MKKLIIIIAVLLTLSYASGRSLIEPLPTRDLDYYNILECSNLGLNVTNYGWMGKVDGGQHGLVWPNLYNEGYCEHLHQGSLWVSGLRYRRNGAGQLLYWLPNPEDENDVVTETDEEWTPDLKVVLDTLTTTGYDGDLDLKEFLPAYNPLETYHAENYQYYNGLDVLMQQAGQFYGIDDDNDGLIDEDDLGRPWAQEDIYGNWCFTIPYDDDGDGQFDEDYSYPGFETTLAYYYDYSPFGTAIDRDWGNQKSMSSHYPLGLAVEQQTWSYPVASLQNIVYVNWKITNTSAIDSLKYLSYGLMIDADIGPLGWNYIYNDDVSSYNGEPDYEYAFSYDYDGDEGLSESILAAKMLNFDYGYTCWAWEVGDGPDDSDPLDFNPSGLTANEKYWLMTYRNPNDEKYTSLRDFPNGQVAGNGCDTRFMYSIYGAMPHTGDMDENGILDYLETDEQGNYFKRYDLAPLESIDITAVLFVGTNTEELENTCNEAVAFYNSDFDLTPYMGEPCVPILNSVGIDNHQVVIDMFCLTTPDTLWLKYKQVDAPASDWIYINLPVDTSEYTVTEITESDYYEFVVAVAYGDVYLESRKETFYFDNLLNEDENEISAPAPVLYNYPNPFNPSTTIFWQQENAGQTSLSVYDIKGQKIRDLTSKQYATGEHSIIWNGCDGDNNTCSSGIYL
ncbi:MAG: FlgD immunoglobulin-like domain containing protein, partial [Candidatus Stygibacter australis]|nr:FlgD immunoglobulin-like domain containing protein [Candidatus Stygibacter australis]